MNTIRTPRGPRDADRQGLCRAGEVIERLLARYGIRDEAPANPPSKLLSTAAVVSPNQQTFPWFDAIQTPA